MTFPLSEMLGLFVGYAITDPRLPYENDNGEKDGGLQSARALWNVSEELVQ